MAVRINALYLSYRKLRNNVSIFTWTHGNPPHHGEQLVTVHLNGGKVGGLDQMFFTMSFGCPLASQGVIV